MPLVRCRLLFQAHPTGSPERGGVLLPTTGEFIPLPAVLVRVLAGICSCCDRSLKGPPLAAPPEGPLHTRPGGSPWWTTGGELERLYAVQGTGRRLCLECARRIAELIPGTPPRAVEGSPSCGIELELRLLAGMARVDLAPGELQKISRFVRGLLDLHPEGAPRPPAHDHCQHCWRREGEERLVGWGELVVCVPCAAGAAAMLAGPGQE